MFPGMENLPVPFRIAKEYILNLAGALIIGYIIDGVFADMSGKMSDNNEWFPAVTVIMVGIALLAATYRSYRILKGKSPDG